MPPDFSESESFKPKFDFEHLLQTYRYPLLIFLVGLLLLGGGVLYMKGFFSSESGKVEVLSATASAGEKGTDAKQQELVVEISGAIKIPGVYKMEVGSRVDDVIQKAGGITEDADKNWMAKSLNRAAKINDGQKLYIPKENEQANVVSAKSSSTNSGGNVSRTIISDASNGLININAASTSELDSLPGIGSTYAQKIIDQRPYSNIEELLSKKVVPKSTYEKIKEKISVY